ncbi:hypothetical protein BH10BAC1_BH10BAC1_03790 [soil metagenome]
METTNKLGIWMDHSNAHLIEFKKESASIRTISTTFNHEDKEAALSRSEHVMHNKSQQQNAIYYKKLADEISKYDDVILFGPTDAKTELFNLLKSDQKIGKIKIEVKSADKMTENQQQAFVDEHFSI